MLLVDEFNDGRSAWAGVIANRPIPNAERRVPGIDALGAASCNSTAPRIRTASLPTVTPGETLANAPTHAPSSIVIGFKTRPIPGSDQSWLPVQRYAPCEMTALAPILTFTKLSSQTRSPIQALSPISRCQGYFDVDSRLDDHAFPDPGAKSTKYRPLQRVRGHDRIEQDQGLHHEPQRPIAARAPRTVATCGGTRRSMRLMPGGRPCGWQDRTRRLEAFAHGLEREPARGQVHGCASH